MATASAGFPVDWTGGGAMAGGTDATGGGSEGGAIGGGEGGAIGGGGTGGALAPDGAGPEASVLGFNENLGLDAGSAGAEADAATGWGGAAGGGGGTTGGVEADPAGPAGIGGADMGGRDAGAGADASPARRGLRRTDLGSVAGVEPPAGTVGVFSVGAGGGGAAGTTGGVDADAGVGTGWFSPEDWAGAVGLSGASRGFKRSFGGSSLIWQHPLAAKAGGENKNLT